MADTSLQLPVTPLSRPYWEAAADGRLVAPRCKSCDRYFFAPEVACKHCFSTDWTYVEVSGRGSLYSYTTVYRAPEIGMAVPYVLGVIDLEEGFSMFAHVVECAPACLICGLPLEVDFLPLHDGRIAPVFKPSRPLHDPRVSPAGQA